MDKNYIVPEMPMVALLIILIICEITINKNQISNKFQKSKDEIRNE